MILTTSSSPFEISTPVGRALQLSLPVVALESAVITHGLPRNHNLTLARDIEQEVLQEGATPATIAVLDGKIQIGLTGIQLERLASDIKVRKFSPRDFPRAVINQECGGTTVAGTLFVAHRVGIKVFATGGIGGVHPHPPFDISADLPILSETPVIVVCSGAKALLDIPATLEYLETVGVPVIGYRTDDFPAFYSLDSGNKVSTRIDTPEKIIEFAINHWKFGLQSAILVTQPPPSQFALSNENVNTAILQAQQDAKKKNVRGQELTPFLLQRISELTNGATLRTNIKLLHNNARLAAQIAGAYSAKKRKIL